MNTSAGVIHLINRNHRQSNNKSRALISTSTLSLNCPTMKFDQVLYDCQTQSHAPVLSCTSLIGLAEAIENVRQELWSNALSRITHYDLHVGIYSFQSHLY